MNTTLLMLLVFLAAVVLSWLLTRRVVARWKRTLEATETLLLGVCVFGIVFFIVGGLSIAGAYVYRQFARQVGSAISETAEAIEEAKQRYPSTEKAGTESRAMSPLSPVDGEYKAGRIEETLANGTVAGTERSETADVDVPDGPDGTDVETAAPTGTVPKASTFTGTVVGNGRDNVLVETENGPIQVRLAGIDAPQKGQAHALEAKRRLSAKVRDKTVKVVSVGTDESGKVVGVVYRDEDCVNTWMVREGWAWYYPEFFYESEALAEAQEEARRAKRGLWAHPDPLAPWEWREVVGAQDADHGNPWTLVAEQDASVVRLSFIRKTYRVLVRPGLSEPMLRATLLHFSAHKLLANPDIDAIIVLAFEEQKGRVVDFTPIGMLGWAPDGKWDNVSAEIGKTNDRSSYKYYIEISEAFRKKQGDKSPPE